MPSNALPRMPSLLDGFVARLRKTRARSTAVAYEKIARAFIGRFSEAGLSDLDAVEDFVTTPNGAATPYAIATRNHRLAALKALSKHALATGVWSRDPTASLEFVRAPARDPAVLSVGEVQRLFATLNTISPQRQLARDRAMLAVLFTLGLRVHELVGLDVDQVDFMSAELIDVQGKGATSHHLPLEPTTLGLLAIWLNERQHNAKLSENALFVSRLGKRMSTRAVQRFFQRLRAATGTKKKITPHTARHSAATLAFIAGADISSIGELLRHADINVTRRYVHLVDPRKRQVAELLSRVIPIALRQPDSGATSPKTSSATGALSMSLTPPANDTSIVPPAFPSQSSVFGAANDNAKNAIDGKDHFDGVG